MEALKSLVILLLAAPIWMILHAIATAHNLGLATLGLGLAAVIGLLAMRTRKRRPRNQTQGAPQHRCRPSPSRSQDISIQNDQSGR